MSTYAPVNKRSRSCKDEGQSKSILWIQNNFLRWGGFEVKDWWGYTTVGVKVKDGCGEKDGGVGDQVDGCKSM